MARTIITSKMIQEINDLYYELRNKSAVAREMGISASTVSKYIQDGYVPKEELTIRPFDLAAARKIVEDFILSKEDLENPRLLILNDEEVTEIEELWEELSI